MCGICGYISKTEYSQEILERMNDTMTHRGPDDSGTFQQKLRNRCQIGMAQRRLSILDLSSAGHQPMVSDDGDIIIVYNGEIYNFIELRRELEQKGYVFQSNCDTEVILCLYREYGIECLKMLNGMFAFAIMDLKEERLLLARDRMGKKPLYYYFIEKKVFAFGSELKPLIKFPEFRKEIRAERISAYLVNKSFASPDTVFENTYKVEPGQYILWCRGEIHKGQFWNLLERFEIGNKDLIEEYGDAKKGLRNLLLDSISKRMMADVPVGAFLSGGIDSTLVTALAKEVSSKPMQTFTIGFSTFEENEAEYAKAVAKYLGTKHTEVYISHGELLEQIKYLATYYDEPFADSSQIPTMLVSKVAKSEVTVALSGDGGDELFCGYEMYDWMKLAQDLDGFGTVGYWLCQLPGINSMRLMERLPDKPYAFLNNRDEKTKIQLFNDVRERYTKDLVVGDSISSKYAYERDIKQIDSIKDNWQIQRMLLDMRYYLADEVLVKTDRASMRYSLEVRCPLLDYRIVEYSFRIPHAFKYNRRDKKYILKDIVYDMVPKELLDRPKKGFGVPLVKWLREDLNSSLMRYADKEILRRQGIFREEKIHEFIGRMMRSELSVYNSVLWGFMIFQMWYQKYIEDLWNM